MYVGDQNKQLTNYRTWEFSTLWSQSSRSAAVIKLLQYTHNGYKLYTYNAHSSHSLRDQREMTNFTLNCLHSILFDIVHTTPNTHVLHMDMHTQKYKNQDKDLLFIDCFNNNCFFTVIYGNLVVVKLIRQVSDSPLESSWRVSSCEDWLEN